MIGYRDGFIAVGGSRLRYVGWGSTDAPTMVLLHGVEDSALSWERLAAAMSDCYQVVALDQRGHGQSQWASPDRYRLGDFVSDLEALVEQLGLRGAVLLGHAEGGRHALSYASLHPDETTALIVIDADLEAANPPHKGKLSCEAVADGEWESLAAVIAHLRHLQPAATDDLLAHHAQCLTKELPDGRRAWNRDPALLGHYEGPDLWDRWRSLQCPTLIVRGRQSDVIGHEAAVRMREAIGRVRLAELDGGGHWFHREYPGALEATVRWFLDNPPA